MHRSIIVPLSGYSNGMFLSDSTSKIGLGNTSIRTFTSWKGKLPERSQGGEVVGYSKLCS